MRHYLGEHREEIQHLALASGGSVDFTLVDGEGNRHVRMTFQLGEQGEDLLVTCDAPSCQCAQNTRYHTSASHARGALSGTGRSATGKRSIDAITYARLIDANGTTLAEWINRVLPDKLLKQALREAHQATGVKIVLGDTERNVTRLRETWPRSLEEARENAKQLIDV